MVVILLIAAHALGQDERTLRRVEQEAARKAEKAPKARTTPSTPSTPSTDKRQKSDV
jgi:hypothetical protein